VSFFLRDWPFGEGPFIIIVLYNEKDIIGAVSLNTFIIGDFRVNISPISGIFSEKDSFSINYGLMRGNIFRVGFLILSK